MTAATREQWLRDAAKLLADTVFEDHEVPEFHISVGWPGGKGKKASVIGQCWNTACSEDDKSQVFISPILKDRVEVLRCMVHEMIHVIDNCKHGHRGLFLTIFRKVGMTGKATECAAGPELTETLKGLLDKLGEYPHAKMTTSSRTGERLNPDGPAPQKNRNLLVECADCGYKVRTSATNLAERGAPICPCNMEPMEQKEGK